MKVSLLAILGVLLLLSCQPSRKSELIWNRPIFRIGSQSSPVMTDLNADGVKDLIMGAGKAELAQTDHGVFALDGTSGKMLWKVKTDAHIVGSATLYDLNGDEIQDVFIGGRNHQLLAINGKNGEVFWRYETPTDSLSILSLAKFNFYRPAIVPDQNGDGKDDLLCINGGNWDAIAGDESERVAGVLLLINSMNGEIIKADTMPDGKESYMSPVVYPHGANAELRILFGTGGETVSGQLFQISLKEFMNSGLSTAKALIKEDGHGFIAPPAILDINMDGLLDIVAVSHRATITAIDGQSHKPLWQQTFEGMESSNALGIGDFNRKKGLDIVANFSKGIWPDYVGAMQVMIDGPTGEIQYRSEYGCGNLSSPVVYDLNRDGIDDAIMSITDYDCSLGITADTMSPENVESKLVYLDFRDRELKNIERSVGFKNFFSTPWIGDVDGDDYLDLVHCQYARGVNLVEFLGMRIRRISLPVMVQKPVSWGAYMGTDGDGVYKELIGKKNHLQ